MREHQVTRTAQLLARCIVIGVAVLVSACSVRSLREAPIEERSRGGGVTSGAPAVPVAPAPVGSREARDGTYVVQRGDTLYSIALEFGRDWRDIARWNGLDDPTKLRVGQPLRVAPSAEEASVAAAAPIAPVASVEVRPLTPATGPTPLPPVAAATPAPPAVPPPPAPTAAPPPVSSPPPPPPPPPPSSPPAPPKVAEPAPSTSADSAVPRFVWPVEGTVVEAFNETRNKGIDIAGREGDAVRAAGDGQVVYVGNTLRGYGNLLIIKHSDDFISAYAHNKTIVVKQGQEVKRGQRVAELGKTDGDAVRLHFEIRRGGQPVDPVKFLPAR